VSAVVSAVGGSRELESILMGLNEAGERTAAVMVTTHSLYVHFTELLSRWLIVVRKLYYLFFTGNNSMFSSFVTETYRKDRTSSQILRNGFSFTGNETRLTQFYVQFF
jgi:hypothetical protein